MIEAMLKMTLMPQKQRRLCLEELNAREIANEFAFPLAKSFFDILRQTDIFF